MFRPCLQERQDRLERQERQDRQERQEREDRERRDRVDRQEREDKQAREEHARNMQLQNQTNMANSNATTTQAMQSQHNTTAQAMSAPAVVAGQSMIVQVIAIFCEEQLPFANCSCHHTTCATRHKVFLWMSLVTENLCVEDCADRSKHLRKELTVSISCMLQGGVGGYYKTEQYCGPITICIGVFLFPFV